MKKILMPALLVLVTQAIYGQNILTSAIRWNASQTTYINTGEVVDEATTITSYTDRIEWKTADGTLKYKLKLLEVTGSWSNIAVDGQIIFEVDKDGYRGTVQFRKQSTIVSIKILLLTNGAPDVYEMTIATTELL